uniref:Cilia- and flagella-associated protein 36 n=1 Tax=Globodera rostochiensis TaxID=31243 RepID=A0A914GSP5_GLORO
MNGFLLTFSSFAICIGHTISPIGILNEFQFCRTPSTIYPIINAILAPGLWQIPISEFIEQHSIVFDRDSNVVSVPSSADSHQSLYAEFQRIVRDLLEAHCLDVGTTHDQLMEALKSTEQTKELSPKERLLLEPIVAAQDFDVFVPMMMRKNIELQLQALKMIEHMNGLLPNSLKLGQEEAAMWNELGDVDETDRFIMISVLKESREEWERDQRLRQELLAQMEAALHESLRDKPALEEMRRREQTLLEQALNKSAYSFKLLNLNNEEAEKLPGTSAEMEPTEKSQRKEESKDVQKSGDLAYRSLLKEREAIPEGQLNDRRQYLREQRDKLLKKKSKEREKQFIEAAKQVNDSRPQTAKAARELMEQKSEVEEVRRRIAAKIKAEVMGGAKSN